MKGDWILSDAFTVFVDMIMYFVCFFFFFFSILVKLIFMYQTNRAYLALIPLVMICNSLYMLPDFCLFMFC